MTKVDLKMTVDELDLLDKAKKICMQSRNQFVSKAAIERMKKVLAENDQN